MGRLLISLILTLSIFSCTKSSKLDENTLNVPIAGQISTLDPAQSFDTISASVIYQGYDQLFEYHYLKRPYQVQPLLATSMPKIENDGTRYIINIRSNIRYHDDPVFEGKPRYVKAEDFITQIKRLAFLPTNSNGWWLFKGKIKGIDEFRKQAGNDLEKFKSLKVEGLTATDDTTLIIDLVKPHPQMLYALTMTFASPMPMEAVMKYNNDLGERIIGTGAYKLKSWTRNSIITFERFENYHNRFYPAQGDRLANSRELLKDAGKKLPFIERVNFKVIKEAQTRWLNFLKGKIDYLALPKDNYNTTITPSGELNSELKKKKIKLQIFPSLTYWWLSFNMNDPIVGKNLNLRKAIAHAIDYDRYITMFTNNIGQKANSIYPPGIAGYDPSNVLPYEYSLEKAKEYLAKAGYPNGKGLPIIKYDTRGSNTTIRQRAEFIKTSLSKIGIKIDVHTNNFPAFLDKAKKGKLQFWLDGWALDYPDAENVLQLLISKNVSPYGPNSTFYSNKKVDDLFDQLKILPDGKEKFDLMVKIEKEVNEQLPWVMLFYSRNYIVSHERLKNFRHSDIIYNQIKYLKIDNR